MSGKAAADAAPGGAMYGKAAADAAPDKPAAAAPALCGVRNADCTLLHRAWDEAARRDVWRCTPLPGVSWYAGRGVTVGTSGETAADAAVIRVYTQEPLAVDVGDLLVPGLVTAQAASSADVLRRFPNSVKVLRVRDNRRGSPQMQHWYIEGA